MGAGINLKVMERRHKVGLYLMNHIANQKMIAEKIGDCTVKDIENDVKWIKEQVGPWIDSLASEGYAFDVKMGIDKLKQLETELEALKQEAPREEKPDLIMKIADITIARLVAEGEGPTLMSLRRFKKKELGQTT